MKYILVQIKDADEIYCNNCQCILGADIKCGAYDERLKIDNDKIFRCNKCIEMETIFEGDF